jgi:hypothetical protein
MVAVLKGHVLTIERVQADYRSGAEAKGCCMVLIVALFIC